MKFLAAIDIMPRPELLDPQGKTVLGNLSNLNINGVEDVRIGKHITLTVEAASASEAEDMVKSACEKLLANTIMETYQFDLSEVAE